MEARMQHIQGKAEAACRVHLEKAYAHLYGNVNIEACRFHIEAALMAITVADELLDDLGDLDEDCFERIFARRLH